MSRPMCDICGGYKSKSWVREGETLEATIDDLGKQWWLDLWLHKQNPYWEDENISCPITFCPFCGRELPTSGGKELPTSGGKEQR